MNTKQSEITPELMDDIYCIITLLDENYNSENYTNLIITLDALDEKALTCTMYGCLATSLELDKKGCSNRYLTDIANACGCILNQRGCSILSQHGVYTSQSDARRHIENGDWVFARDAEEYVKDLCWLIVTDPFLQHK